jgi:hypothetical protein
VGSTGIITSKARPFVAFCRVSSVVRNPSVGPVTTTETGESAIGVRSHMSAMLVSFPDTPVTPALNPGRLGSILPR